MHPWNLILMESGFISAKQFLTIAFFENTTVISDQAIAELFAYFQTKYSTLPDSEQPYSYAVSKSYLYINIFMSHSKRKVTSLRSLACEACLFARSRRNPWLCSQIMAGSLVQASTETLYLISLRFLFVKKISNWMHAIPKLFENAINPYLQHPLYVNYISTV